MWTYMCIYISVYTRHTHMWAMYAETTTVTHRAQGLSLLILSFRILVTSSLPLLICCVRLFIYNREQNKRDRYRNRGKKQNTRKKEREEVSFLPLDIDLNPATTRQPTFGDAATLQTHCGLARGACTNQRLPRRRIKRANNNDS